MSKTFLFLFLISSLILFSCDVLQEKTNNNPQEKRKITIIQPDAEQPQVNTRNYQFKTGQNHIRKVIRTYYGLKAEMQNLFGGYEIRKGLNIEQYQKFSKASFFASEEYKIPSEMTSKASSMYRPLVDSIFNTIQPNKKNHIEILVLGYTDEAPFSTSSPTYNSLLSLEKKANFNTNDYYYAISFYRANEVANILSPLIFSKLKETSLRNTSFDIIIEGKGIEYPDAKRQYQLEDDKRKITKVYWRIY